MKIIIYVDFSHKDFNKDFMLSQSLLPDHTVLLVTNKEQLSSSIGTYDLVLLGFSCAEGVSVTGKPVFDAKTASISELNKILK